MGFVYSAISHSVQSEYLWTLAFTTLHQTLSPSHRFPDLHDCPSLVEKVANPRPIKIAPSSTQRSTPIIPTRKPPTDPIKQAQWRKVEAMKMRHRANPVDPKDRVSSVPIDHRVHVRVLRDNEEKILWLRKVSVWTSLVNVSM